MDFVVEPLAKILSSNEGYRLLIYPDEIMLGQKEDIADMIELEFCFVLNHEYVERVKDGLSEITDNEVEENINWIPEEQKLHLIEFWYKPQECENFRWGEPDSEEPEWSLLTFYTIQEDKSINWDDNPLMQDENQFYPLIHQIIYGSREGLNLFWKRWGIENAHAPNNYYHECPFSYPEDNIIYPSHSLGKTPQKRHELKQKAYQNLKELKIPVQEPEDYL